MTDDTQIVRQCPFCGNDVRLSADGPSGSTVIDPRDRFDQQPPKADPPGMDRVVHALCGCYIFEMPDSALGRLLASVLATTEEDTADEGVDP
ncbi:MAG: hypothetical protein ACYCX3_04105 [Thermoleophilia bacterium]